MKVQILKENLKRVLSVVEKASAKTPTLPILGTVLLTAEKNTLELSATDLEMGIRHKTLAKTEKEGQVVVPARLFSQLVATLSENEVMLNAKKEGLRIESKGEQTTIKTLSAEEFPIIPSLRGTEEAVEVAAKELCDGIGQVVGMVGQNQARPEISGVLFCLQKEGIKLAATDSFRLAEKTIGASLSREGEVSFILPQKTARETASILSDLEGKVKIYFSPTQVLFDCTPKGEGSQGALQIVSRLIEGEYPQYQDVIPKDFPTKARVSRSQFIARLKAASVFAGKLQDASLSVLPQKKGLEISSQSADAGSHSSFLAGEIQGKPLEVSFNWRFLLEGAMNIQSQELDIGFAGEDAPALLRPVSKEQYLYVVMPVKA